MKTQGEKNSTNPKTQGLFGAKTQRTGSEIAIMNFKTSNICAERAEKMQFLVYFDQISPKKFKKWQNTFKLKLSLKKSSFLASKLNEPVVSHYTPLP